MAGNTDIIKKLGLDTRDTETDSVVFLIQNCIEGDLKAQRLLYEQYAPFLKGVIVRYISDTETVKDLLNDIFSKIFIKLDKYKPTGAFKAWIRTIAVNTIIDHVRKNMKHKDTHYIDYTEQDVYVPDDINGKIAYKELLQLIQDLPDTQKTVFNLFVFENLTHKEISTLLTITENNSRWYLSDARKRLKEKLERLMPK
ncbi:MAG: RNA polymerase sigma factor [Flavipsychrobacter sp.]